MFVRWLPGHAPRTVPVRLSVSGAVRITDCRPSMDDANPVVPDWSIKCNVTESWYRLRPNVHRREKLHRCQSDVVIFVNCDVMLNCV